MTKGSGSKLERRAALPSSPKARRLQIAEFARELRQLIKQKQYPPPISPDLADYVVRSFYGYLRGKPNCQTLDFAFGLDRPGPGRKKGSGTKLKLVYEIADDLFAGLSINKIANARNLQRIEIKNLIYDTYKDEYVRYIAKKISKRIDETRGRVLIRP